MIETKYINIFGGPGIGKSTTAAIVFTELKKRSVNVELVTEVAKDFVWEDRMKTLMIQPYVTVKQFRNLVRVKGQVEYVVTDAPVMLGILYANKYAKDLPSSYVTFVADLHRHVLQPSINIMLERTHKYDANGRYQTEDEAKKLDQEIENILSAFGVSYIKSKPQDILSHLGGIQ